MPADRKAYMRQYMAERRAAAKARKTDEKTSPHGPVNTATPQPQAQPGVAAGPAKVVARHEWTADLDADVTRVGTMVDAAGNDAGVVLGIRPRSPRPSFLAAPDDDCMSCGHDRQSYHLDGPCRMPTGPRARCGCPVFVSSAEPF